ncbi:MAG: PAS domain S-box protein [Tepidisphaeraceae bacterium]
MGQPIALLRAVRNPSGRVENFAVNYINAVGAALNRRIDSDPTGQLVTEIAPRFEGVGLLADYIRVIETGEPLEKTYTIPCTSGDALTEVHVSRVDNETLVVAWRDCTEEKRAGEALKHSERRYRALVDSAAQIVWHTDAAGRVLEQQPSWSAFTGQTFDECQGLGWLNAIHADDRPAVQAEWMRCLTAKSIYRNEHRLRRADGQYRLMTAHGVPILNDNGDVVEWIGTHIDITDFRAAEARLAGSERFYHQIIDALPHLTWTCAPSGLCDYLSKSWLDYTGRSLDQLLGYAWVDLVHPDDRGRVERTWAECVQTHARYDIEFRLRRHDGTYRWYSNTATVLLDDAGRPVKWVGASIDIDDRHHAEQRLRRLYESNLVGITYWTAEGQMLEMNDGLLANLGYTREQFQRDGINWRKITPPEWQSVDDEQMAILNRTGRCGPFEKEYYRRDGSRIPVLVSRADLDPGDHSHGIAFIVDISRLKQVEADLRSSQSALRQLNESLESRVRERTVEAQMRSEQLRALALDLAETESRERKRLAQILHDHFQQLVSAAKLKAGIVRRRLDDSPLVESVRAIEGLLDEAISASRSLATELSPPVLHDAGLAPALDWLVRRVKQDHNLNVDLHIEPGTEPDNEQVRVVLFECVRELLFNIVKHAGVLDASVSLTHLHEGLLQIRVRDAGKGFDASRMNITRKPDGSFGLFSIRERLSLIGGLVTVRSSVGKGTVVDLTVPTTFKVEEAGGEVQPQPFDSIAGEVIVQGTNQSPAEAAALIPTPVRVLVADDHRLFREGLISLIAQEPYIDIVGQAADGAEAVELARSLKPDVMIVDVTMPKLNGIQVTTAVMKELPRTRIIGLSMHERDDMARAMRDAGAIAYCTKGGPTENLIAILRGAATARANEPVTR